MLGFNVRANAQAKALADQSGVEIRYYSIIYDLVDDVKAAMSGLLAPTLREIFLGNAQILQVFNISKVGKVAGCRVTEGKVERGAKVRLIRDNVVIHEGTLSTLKRFKDEVQRGAGRPGVRHGVRQLPGHPRRRRDRVLQRRDDRALALRHVSVASAPATAHCTGRPRRSVQCPGASDSSMANRAPRKPPDRRSGSCASAS